jgi:hypothetical protein
MTMAPHKAARAVTQLQISALIFHSRAIASFAIWMIVHDRFLKHSSNFYLPQLSRNINYFYRNGRNLLPMTAGLIKQLCADLLEFVIPECIYREIQARPELDRRLKHSGVTPLG